MTISYNDFKTLYNNGWINDSVIDFFIEYEIDEAVKNVPTLARSDVFAFSSFFFTKLVSKPAGQANTDYYENIKR